MIAVVVAIAMGAIVVGSAVIARHRAQASADLAALAAAGRVASGGEVACSWAASVAAAMHSVVTTCRVEELDVVVDVEIPVSLGRWGLGSARAAARAGPGESAGCAEGPCPCAFATFDRRYGCTPPRTRRGQGIPVDGPTDPDIRFMDLRTSSSLIPNASAISDTLRPRLRMRTICESRRCVLIPCTTDTPATPTNIAANAMAAIPHKISMSDLKARAGRASRKTDVKVT